MLQVLLATALAMSMQHAIRKLNIAVNTTGMLAAMHAKEKLVVLIQLM
jgi:hypothetical protein